MESQVRRLAVTADQQSNVEVQMAEVKSISIDTKPPGTFRIAARHAIIWSYLIGTEAASHLWFGGSWVVDLMIVTMLVLFVIQFAMKSGGYTVSMTKSEIRLWVHAGMPDDVKAWRANRKLTEVA